MDQLDRDWRDMGGDEGIRGIAEEDPIGEDYLWGVTHGQKCECGADLTVGGCDICGDIVIGCLACHLDSHEVEEGMPNVELAYIEKRHISDQQYHGRLYD